MHTESRKGIHFVVDGRTPANESRRVLAAQSNKKLSESPAFNLPPWTPVEPVVERLHGVEVADPYRWLEDQNSPRTRRWLAEQAAYTRTYFDGIPGRERVRKRVQDLLAVEGVSEPWKVGHRYFFMKRADQQEQPVITVRHPELGGDAVLVDPAERSEGSGRAVSILQISNDGRILAYGVRHSGEDSCAIEFLDVDRRETLPDRLPHGLYCGLAFSPDHKGFYYSHQTRHLTRPHHRGVYFHEFGTEAAQDREVFCAGENPHLQLRLFASTDSVLLAFQLMSFTDPPTLDLFIQDLASGKPARQILRKIEWFFYAFFARRTLLALTDWRAPNRRIVAIDPAHPDRNNWQEIVPESDSRIRDFAVVGKTICVGYLKDLAPRIVAFDLDRRNRKVIPCPTQGHARLLPRPVESDTLFFEFSSFAQPPILFSYDVPSDKQEIWAKNQPRVDLSSIDVRQVRYTSKDGTQVPMFLAAKRGRCVRPTFLTGYGGFGASVAPQFTAYATVLIERGFLFAVANLRGGAEFGEEWHRAGKRHNRQTVFDDFIAGAEWLLQEGHSEWGRIAIGGGSNAGLLVGAALTQRPDLFRAVVCLGPLLDMLRYHYFDLARVMVDEYGSPENEDDFQYLRAYSPYHRVQDGVGYPSVLLVSGDADTRCNPMHARKMAARLQAATVSGRPIVLDYQPAWGHSPVQPLTRRIEALADRLTFTCHELEVNI